MSAKPSGAQYKIALGDQQATVAEVGAALRVYSVGGRDVVVPFGAHEIAPAFHGAVLLPWPNRLGDGRYTFDGVSYQAALTEPERHVALHGLACWERWNLVAHTTSHVILEVAPVPTPGYPFALRARITYGLTPDDLEISLTATNIGDRAAPYGAGFHPWLSPGEGSLDDCMLTIDAQKWVSTNERLLPTGEQQIPEGLDFRKPTLLAEARLDDAFVDATFRGGRSWIRLTGSDGATAAAWMGENLTCWQVCTGDAISDPAYRRSGLAAEPMTCVADAFRNGERLVRLEPGQSHTVHWGLALERVSELVGGRGTALGA